MYVLFVVNALQGQVHGVKTRWCQPSKQPMVDLLPESCYELRCSDLYTDDRWRNQGQRHWTLVRCFRRKL